MTDDLRASLEQIARAAARAMTPVDETTVRRRLRRTRAARRTAGATAALVLVTAVGAGAATLGGGAGVAPPAAPAASGTPTPTATPSPEATGPQGGPVAGWAPWGGICGSTPEVTLADSATLEVQGSVVAGDLDRSTALFHPAADGDVVLFDVATTTETPGLPASGSTGLQVLVLDASGAVVLWNDIDHAIPQVDGGDGTTSLSWLFEARDCRTGQPLDGTYRVVGTDGDETVDLAPLALGTAATTDGRSTVAGDRVEPPACGSPLPEETRALLGAPDLVAATDPGAPLTGLSTAGVHVPVTLTASRTALEGAVPQGLRAFLVDADGVVATGAGVPNAASGAVLAATFSVTPGESFGSEVFQWFSPCPGEPPLTAGAYDLYVLDSVLATDATGERAWRTVAGGPFPVTLTGEW